MHASLGALGSDALNLINRVDIAPTKLRIRLDADALVNDLQIAFIDLPDDVLSITIPCKLRRRGVEARFVIGAQLGERDDILIANIARADGWRREIISGKTLADIANAEDKPTTYIAQMLDFGLLAPDIVKQCLAGQQPPILTTNWLRRHDLPMDWAEQQRLIGQL